MGETTITGYNASNGLKAKVIIHVYNNNADAITVPMAEMGDNFTIVLKEDGTVWTTGQNDQGQLGQGNTSSSNIPLQVKIDDETYLTNIRKISVFYKTVMAMSKDGSVYAWGYGGNGQLGQGNTSSMYYATKMKNTDGTGYLSDIIDISAGYTALQMIDKNGNAWYSGAEASSSHLGLGTSNLPKNIPYVRRAISVTSGVHNQGFILQNGNTVVCGDNRNGQLGTGNTTNQSALFTLGSNISKIVLTGFSGYLIKDNGTLWASGLNDVGQLGLRRYNS